MGLVQVRGQLGYPHLALQNASQRDYTIFAVQQRMAIRLLLR
jgi:hypothetical protein